MFDAIMTTMNWSPMRGEDSPIAPPSAQIHWDRLRPLDQNPALDCGQPLGRAGVPGETVVLRSAPTEHSPRVRAPQPGEFVVCIDNTDDGHLIVVDGLAQRWRVGSDEVNATCGFPDDWTAQDRDFLVWNIAPGTLVLRDSLRNGFEGNFFYLLLDPVDAPDRRALLIDSGTGYANPEPYLRAAIGQRQLLVLSLHSHWDHFGGHGHFSDLPGVQFAGQVPGERYEPYPPTDIERLCTFFDLQDWPQRSASFSLGERALTVIPIPGHTADSLAIHDAREQLLFTGDSVMPGALFIEDWPAALASLARLQDYAEQHPLRWVLGSHVEMSRERPWNGRHEYFNFGSCTRTGEHPLQLPPSTIAEVRQMLEAAWPQADRDAGITPSYDARVTDAPFHDRPFVPAPMRGTAPYYKENNDRLVETLVQRHRAWERTR